MNDLAINPFESRRQVAESAAARVQQARESTEVLALIYSAQQNPRDELRACDRIKDAFSRVGLAEESQYSYQRGGSDINGPSIRSAEAIRLAWCNMSSGWSEVARTVGPDGVGVSEVEAFCIDYETRNHEAIKFPVRHWRDTQRGGYALKDEREIYELCANMAQRRKRQCILALIPGDVVTMAMEQATATMKAKADTTPEGLAKMLAAFAPYGVTQAHIEKRIQRRLDAIQPAQVVWLKRVYASLRDGISTAAEWFDVEGGTDAGPAGAPAPASVADVIKRRAARKPPAAAPPAPAPAPPPAAQAEGGGPVARSLDDYLQAVAYAPDSEAAALVVDEARGFLSDAEQAQLAHAFSSQWQAP